MISPVFVELPASKSLINRLLILASMQKSDIVFSPSSDCQDVLETLNALKSLNFQYSFTKDYYEKDENHYKYLKKMTVSYIPNSNPKNEIFLKEAGTAYRFLMTRLCSEDGKDFSLVVNNKLLNRPIQPLINLLSQMGAKITPKATGFDIKGTKLHGGTYQLDANISSQFVSSILLFAHQLEETLTLILTNKIVSDSYINMTINLLKSFDIKISKNENTIKVFPSDSLLLPKCLNVEPDYSTACYYILYSLMSKRKVFVPYIENSLQGDFSFFKVLESMGCILEIVCYAGKKWISAQYNTLNGIDISMSDMPDQVMTLALLRLLSQDDIIIRDYSNLNFKESKRINVMISEYEKLGLLIIEENDRLIIKKNQNMLKGSVQLITHNDHRFALLFIILSKIYPDISIDNYSCIKKSSPEYLFLKYNIL